MELALYCPVYGYYEKEGDTVGQKGDFYTSVSVGTLFGQLLAVQFAEWLDNSKSEADNAHSTLQLIEGGAHNAALAKDILQWMQEYRPALFERLEYWIVEPSERRQKRQKQVLADFLHKVTWVNGLSELQVDFPQSGSIPTGAAQQGSHSEPAERKSKEQPQRNPGSNRVTTPGGVAVRRIIFCNELLDAMPVHRWGWDAKRKTWFEWGVALRDQQFFWARLPPPTSKSSELTAWPHAPFEPALLEVLPDGFTLETSPSALAWWRQAACVLEAGKLVTLDYGLTQQELFSPERAAGTLRAFRRHHPSLNILTDPGQQDLTADVDFSAIQRCGETAGLKTEAFLTQSQFLTAIAARIWSGEFKFEKWTPKDTGLFKTLTNPEHLGHRFRVLIQSKG